MAYGVTPYEESTERLLDHVRLAIEAASITSTATTATPAQQLRQAQALRPLTRAYNVPLIINDAVALARAIDADGVHLDETMPTSRPPAPNCPIMLGVSVTTI